jgi:hypothetical protein
MVRAVALVAQDRMTRPLSTFPRFFPGRLADNARQSATQASEPSVKSAYEKVAEHWMLLARLDSLIHDETITNPPSKAGP